MPDYSQAPLTFTMGAALGGAIRRFAVDRTGAAKTVLWFDHDAGTWDSEFDPAKHVRPFARQSADPAAPDYKVQALGVPFDVFADPAAALTVYLLDESGAPAAVHTTLGRNDLAFLCDLGA